MVNFMHDGLKEAQKEVMASLEDFLVAPKHGKQWQDLHADLVSWICLEMLEQDETPATMKLLSRCLVKIFSPQRLDDVECLTALIAKGCKTALEDNSVEIGATLDLLLGSELKEMNFAGV